MVIILLVKETIVQTLLIKIFKLVYQTKIRSFLLEKVKETPSEIDDKFLITLDNFVESL